MIWISADLPVIAPYKVGDKVTWREQRHSQERLKRFKDKWGGWTVRSDISSPSKKHTFIYHQGEIRSMVCI